MQYLGSTKLFKQINDCKLDEVNKLIIASMEPTRNEGADVETLKFETQKEFQLKKKILNGELADKEIKTLLVQHCKVTGLKSFLGKMTQETLALLYEDFQVEKEEKKKNKNFLAKSIKRGIEKDFDNYFIELKGDKLKAFTDLTSSQLVPKIIEEITLVGIEILLFSLSAASLKAICDKLGYEVAGNNPNQMVTSILCGEVPAKKEAPAKKVVSFSKKKLPLKKGLTFQDVFQHYYVEELQQFCRDNELKVSGTKKEVITRILNYLNHGVVEQKKATKKKASSKKSTKVDNAAAEQEEEEESEEETKEDAEAEAEAENDAEDDAEDEDDVELVAEDVERPEEVVPKTPTPVKKQISKIVSPTPKSKKSNK